VTKTEFQVVCLSLILADPIRRLWGSPRFSGLDALKQKGALKRPLFKGTSDARAVTERTIVVLEKNRRYTARLGQGKLSMIDTSDRRLPSLSGSNANRLLDRNDKHSAVIDSSCSGLPYNGLDRAPDTTICHHDFKLKFGQKVTEVRAATSHGGVFFPPAQHLYFTDGDPFDSDFEQGLYYRSIRKGLMIASMFFIPCRS
jgi:hypothetical protein